MMHTARQILPHSLASLYTNTSGELDHRVMQTWLTTPDTEPRVPPAHEVSDFRNPHMAERNRIGVASKLLCCVDPFPVYTVTNERTLCLFQCCRAAKSSTRKRSCSLGLRHHRWVSAFTVRTSRMTPASTCPPHPQPLTVSLAVYRYATVIPATLLWCDCCAS